MERTELLRLSEHLNACWSTLNMWHKDQLETGIWTRAVNCVSEWHHCSSLDWNLRHGWDSHKQTWWECFSICQRTLLMKWANTYADMCLRCPCCSKKSTYGPLEGSKDGLHFPPTTSSLTLTADRFFVLTTASQQSNDSVGFINISFAWCRKRREKMERSEAWPQPARLTLSLITVAPCKEERQTRTVCSQGQPGHPVDTQHRPGGLWDSCPLTFRPVVNVISLPAGDRRFPQRFHLWATGPAVGERAWERAPLPAWVRWELLWKLCFWKALPQSFAGKSGLVDKWLKEKLALEE